MKQCAYYSSILNIQDPYKDYGRCSNEGNENCGKPVFEHECKYAPTLACYGRKRKADAEYINSVLIPDGFTQKTKEAMLLILNNPKDKNVKVWKKAIELRLKILLHKFSKDPEMMENRVVVKGLYHHADKLFEILNQDRNLNAYELIEYKVGEDVHWKLMLNDKKIADTKNNR